MLNAKPMSNLGAAHNYGIATANIFYGMPDYPDILQEFIWQTYDTAPDFPALCRFLGFWVRRIEGPLHSVIVEHVALIKPREMKLLNSKKILLN